jgi:hypothetical protein
VDEKWYAAFAAGPFAVQTYDGELIDGRRGDRRLPFAVWHPLENGRWQVVLFSHTSAGYSVS